MKKATDQPAVLFPEKLDKKTKATFWRIYWQLAHFLSTTTSSNTALLRTLDWSRWCRINATPAKQGFGGRHRATRTKTPVHTAFIQQCAHHQEGARLNSLWDPLASQCCSGNV
jgi:hypothetical protein